MPELIYSPRQAAEALGVSGAALRRAAIAYGAAFGDLKRDARGGREFTPEAVDRLRLAFAAVHAGRVASVEVALTMLRDEGRLPVLDPPAPRAGEVEALARAVAGEMLAGLRADLQGLRDENAALRLEVAALRAELTPDRLRVVLHAVADAPTSAPPEAPAPAAPARPAPRRGFFARLLDAFSG